MKFRLAFCALALVLSACGSNPEKDELPPQNPFRADQAKSARELRARASELYKSARASLDASDYQTALERYGQITLRYPFTDYATQAELERIYALHRSFDHDAALSAAEKFMREHPRHAAADYVQYLKGIINMSRDDSFAGAMGLDTTKEDVGSSRRAFDDFSFLIQKYPSSRYNADARQRMIYLRNRLADHDLHVVRYYIKRGAHVAATKRAEQIVQQYPGAPASLEALRLMSLSYKELGLSQQAEDAGKLYAAQLAVTPPAEQPKRSFWARLFNS